MPTSTKVKNLNINELTEAQYDAAVQGGVIGANELSVLTDVSYVEPSDLATVATSGSYNDLTNKPTIPTVGDGTITITQGGVTKGTFTTNQSGNTTIEVDAGGGSGLPDQTGQSGKFLTTDGTDASWSDKPLVNTATGTNAITIGGNSGTGNKSVNIGSSSTADNNCISIGYNATARAVSAYAEGNAIAIGTAASCTGDGRMAIGRSSVASSTGAIAIGWCATASAQYAIQLGGGDAWHKPTNSDANTFKVGNNNGNFEMMSADGTIPAARHASLPAADGTYTLQLVITNGVPTLSWVAV